MDPKALKEALARDSRRLGVIDRALERLDKKTAALVAERKQIAERWPNQVGSDA